MTIATETQLDVAAYSEPKTALIRVVEFALLGLLAWFVAKIIWALFTPITPPVIQATPLAVAESRTDYSILTSFDPFSRKAVIIEPAYEEAGETTLDITVLGTWLEGNVSENSPSGAAILETPDGGQKTYQIGDQITAGVTLQDVRPGQAIISRNGVLETVSMEWVLENRELRSLAANETQNLPPASTVTPDNLIDVVGMRPVNEAGRIIGYEVYARESETHLQALGLKTGDRVIMVNGEPAPTSPQQMFETFVALRGKPFTLTVDRAGSIQEISMGVVE